MAKGDKLGIRFESDWHLVDVKDFEVCDRGSDVAAICPGTHWGEGLSPDYFDGGMFVGEDVAYCGFPLSLETYGLPGGLGWPKGFVKSAIFSGAIARPDGLHDFLFDTINNQGFSGGPILVRNKGRLRVVALVSGYKYDAPSPVYRRWPDGSEELSSDYFIKPNSGFMVGTPIERAVACANKILARLNR
jgi:hypothetical protein